MTAGEKEERIQELVAQALDAKANAPCKALKRRICQRARKKLAHLLTQEEFELAVARLKCTDPEAVQEASTSEDVTPVQDPQICLRVPIFAVPFFIPVMQTQLPRAVAEEPHNASSDVKADGRTESHGNAETPRAFGTVLNYDFKADGYSASIASDSTTPRGVYYVPQERSAVEQQAETADESPPTPTWQRALTEGCVPVCRTFIHYDTCVRVSHRRSRSV